MRFLKRLHWSVVLGLGVAGYLVVAALALGVRI